jgi:lysophospholipase L1-like esterase
MKRLGSIIIFLSILTICEFSIRIFYKPNTRLDEIISILLEDQKLLWRFKPNIHVVYQGVDVHINSLGFRGEELASRKDADSIRVFCMGASPTFGWGVSFNHIYSQKLEQMLREVYKTKRIDVINAGIIGYSSFQGALLLENVILKLSPDVVTIPYLINDVDRNRFFRSNGSPDNGLESQDPHVIYVRNLLSKSRIYRLIQNSIQPLFFRKAISGSRRNIKLPQIRVSAKDYSLNLKKIIEICKKNNIKIVLIKMPLNLPLPPPMQKVSEQKLNYFIEEGLKYMKMHFYDQAVSKFKEAIVTSPTFSEAHYYLGVCYEFKKDYVSAESEFKKAKDYDSFRCRIDSQLYNKTMETVAEEENVPLVDIVKAFKNKEQERLFLYEKSDPIHPSMLGHRIIAEEIYKVFLKWDIIK